MKKQALEAHKLVQQYVSDLLLNNQKKNHRYDFKNAEQTYQSKVVGKMVPLRSRSHKWLSAGNNNSDMSSSSNAITTQASAAALNRSSERRTRVKHHTFRNYKISLNRIGQSFAQFIPLNRLWNEYFEQLAHKSNPMVLAGKVPKMDFHGAMIRVVSSRQPSLVGLSGIVVLESKFTFTVVSPDNLTRRLPKRGSVFVIDPSTSRHRITIYGSNLCFRSSERAVRKFK